MKKIGIEMLKMEFAAIVKGVLLKAILHFDPFTTSSGVHYCFAFISRKEAIKWCTT